MAPETKRDCFEPGTEKSLTETWEKVRDTPLTPISQRAYSWTRGRIQSQAQPMHPLGSTQHQKQSYQ